MKKGKNEFSKKNIEVLKKAGIKGAKAAKNLKKAWDMGVKTAENLRTEKKQIIEDEKNCVECIHREVCKKYLDESKLLFTKKETFNEIGIEIGNNCPNFYYKKIDTYFLDDFKKLLKNRIENSDNPYHLLIIDSIMKLLKKNDKRIRSKNDEKKTE